MSKAPVDPATPIDPARLEAGLQRLRELGYLQSPAEAYLTRRVGVRRSDRQTVLAVGLWVGGALGVLGSLLLLVSAVLSEPMLLERPQILLWLWLEITLVLVLVGAVVTGMAAALMLVLRVRGAKLRPARLEWLVVLVPALASTLYLADRLGRALAGLLPGEVWWAAALLVAIAVGSVGSAVARSVSAAVALGRMQGSQFEPGPALSRGQRVAPWFLLSGAALGLLVLGPYRGLDTLPALDAVVPVVAQSPAPLLLITLDGIADPQRMGWTDAQAIAPGAKGSSHPAAYWNEIFTGFAAREHGVAGAAAAGLRGWSDGAGQVSEDPFLAVLLRQLLPGVGLGETIAADRRELRRPPVWEIAAVAGRRARAVNGWATYPAARREGLEIVTDREFLRLYDGAVVDSFLVWPPSFAVHGGEVWKQELERVRSSVAGYKEGVQWLRTHAATDDRLAEIWDLATAADLHHLRRATEGLDPRLGPTLVVAHLSGIDILGRALRDLPDASTHDLLRSYERFLITALDMHGAPQGYATVILARARPDTGDALERAWVVGSAQAPAEPRHWASWLLWGQGIVPARDLVVGPSIPATILDRERPATFGRLQFRESGPARSGADLERLRSLGYIGG